MPPKTGQTHIFDYRNADPSDIRRVVVEALSEHIETNGEVSDDPDDLNSAAAAVWTALGADGLSHQEPGPEIQQVKGRMSGDIYRRETDNYGGRWIREGTLDPTVDWLTWQHLWREQWPKQV